MKHINEKRLEEARVYYDFPGDYKPWSGAVDTWNFIEEHDAIDALEQYLDECYPDGIDETELNDLLWFESEYIISALGLEEDDEEDEDEEEFEESKITERTHKKSYGNHIVGFVEPGEWEQLFHKGMACGFITEDGETYLFKDCPQEVYDTFPKYELSHYSYKDPSFGRPAEEEMDMYESKMKENWEKDCSDYYDAHHDDKWYNLSDDEKAEYYNNWSEGTLNESKIKEGFGPENDDHRVIKYHGYCIEKSFYDDDVYPYSVQYCGDDCMFKTLKAAKEFIDDIHDVESIEEKKIREHLEQISDRAYGQWVALKNKMGDEYLADYVIDNIPKHEAELIIDYLADVNGIEVNDEGINLEHGFLG